LVRVHLRFQNEPVGFRLELRHFSQGQGNQGLALRHACVSRTYDSANLSRSGVIGTELAKKGAT